MSARNDFKSTAVITKKIDYKPVVVIGAGGGVLGIAEMGGWQRLVEKGVADKVEVLVGTSIATMIFAGAAVNLPMSDEIADLESRKIDLRKFLDLPSIAPAYLQTIKTLDKLFPFLHRKDINTPYAFLRMMNQLFPRMWMQGLKSLMNISLLLAQPIKKYGLRLLVLMKYIHYITKKFAEEWGIFAGQYIETIVQHKMREGLAPHRNNLLLRVMLCLNNQKLRHGLIVIEAMKYKNNWSDAHAVSLLNELRQTLENGNSLTLGGLHLIKLIAPELKFKDLVSYVTNISTDPMTSEYFSYVNKPHLPVEKAVRASMAIPYVYTRVEIDGILYIDGGPTCNNGSEYMRINPFARGKEYLIFDFGRAPKLRPPKNLGELTVRLSGALMASQRAHRTPEDEARTVRFVNLGSSITDFFATPAKQRQIYDKGYAAPEDFIYKTRPFK